MRVAGRAAGAGEADGAGASGAAAVTCSSEEGAPLGGGGAGGLGCFPAESHCVSRFPRAADRADWAARPVAATAGAGTGTPLGTPEEAIGRGVTEAAGVAAAGAAALGGARAGTAAESAAGVMPAAGGDATAGSSREGSTASLGAPGPAPPHLPPRPEELCTRRTIAGDAGVCVGHAFQCTVRPPSRKTLPAAPGPTCTNKKTAFSHSCKPDMMENVGGGRPRIALASYTAADEGRGSGGRTGVHACRPDAVGLTDGSLRLVFTTPEVTGDVLPEVRGCHVVDSRREGARGARRGRESGPGRSRERTHRSCLIHRRGGGDSGCRSTAHARGPALRKHQGARCSARPRASGSFLRPVPGDGGRRVCQAELLEDGTALREHVSLQLK